ncbi:dna mismatch repair msh6 protein [Rutstroemia sp. NJR-2017a WRK4]|nr:dna mismatch repair msh6 protein [Rutstroemia sp. NJR-2017a WRK4]
MARNRNNEETTPARSTPTLKKQSSSVASTKNQASILGFFSKKPASTPTPSTSTSTNDGVLQPNGSVNSNKSTPKPTGTVKKPLFRKSAQKSTTPVPSSDNIEPGSSQENENGGIPVEQAVNVADLVLASSPSRKVKKVVSYAESEDDDEDVAPKSTQRRKTKKPIIEDDEDDEDDVFVGGMDGADDDDDDEMDDFVVEDDSDGPSRSSKKRKRPTSTTASRKRTNISSPPRPVEDDEDMVIPEASTAQQWKYDPDNIQPLQQKPSSMPRTPNSSDKKYKEKAHKTDPDQRYEWLANLRDIDRNPPGHPDYDPRTVYIPTMAWNKFSPFEKQYWEIKQMHWDTIVFFKKGKFYELYENDATIGHQLFDLKLTDRVNMRMVGVPEMSLDHWANQFVAKGFKIAIVNQCESALGKEMREREDSAGPPGKGKKAAKPDKIIRRELSCVLTGGTLVEASMLQDDSATYCVAIKESVTDDELPAFGIAFVDTATGQFFLTEFTDDVDLTKFETFVAQTRPQELLLEKSCISSKALRILKNNTGPTTIWNHLKPGKEFWGAEMARRELDCGEYFVSAEGEEASWPKELQEARDNDLLMSAFGALVQYLKSLKLEKNLLTQANFSRYNPIQKGSTLVLDGQTLINLEIFANTFDGNTDGTLFTLLNRCTTPFGKRMFKQWVSHPLSDIQKINERLDAVDMLNQDRNLSDSFTSAMTKMPDLERLISRIHAGVCKAEDFVKVLEGFEQIEYMMSLLSQYGGGEGIIDRLLAAMPDLAEPLKWWQTAFDREKAKEHKILVPERGVEEDFDASQDRIEEIHEELQSLLKEYQSKLGSKKIEFKNIGKEIYQLQVPASIKVPKDWKMMSSAAGFKRYYFGDLTNLIRDLQETQETHGQIVKEVAGRFYARFDQDYATWLQAVKVIAQLDCLISLASASSALGSPSCRPTFVDSERSVVEFEELRHPCVLPNVTDFIPNDVKLGGDSANINLLTGANAAGKSTILRMTCIAVIMAQIGCYVPAISATLTPVDRIMSRLGANDNIFAAQSTFFVELSETKKILSEATPRSLVILDELGRGTSSYDGVAVAQAVLHHVASHIGCIGFFATHYHSLALEFERHPEVVNKRMQIQVDDEARTVTFLYKLEEGVAEGSFGMHCASMCGIPRKVVERAEVAAKEWEYTSRLKESLERAKSGCYVPLGVLSDVAWCLKDGAQSGNGKGTSNEGISDRGLDCLLKAIEAL